MSFKTYIFIICICISSFGFTQTNIIDAETKYPVSYATISFGNGQGIFADDEGVFVFTKKLYPDIDSLYISALGFKELAISTINLPKTIALETQVNALDEVVITKKINRKFKKETLKPYLDDDYYKCWLPTIESEIAVYFKNEDQKLKKITTVYFPFALESRNWKKRKRTNTDKRKFSTLFKVKFYTNINGTPGKPINTSTIVFRATEQHGDKFELDVSKYDIFIPKSGIFVSLQVLGYTDLNGKLLPNKKYKEIKTRNKTVKIPTNFRPLLPFTDEISQYNTFIKRVFISGNNWVQFKKGNSIESSLLKSNLNNYGIGLGYNVYKDE
ncbi:peptidase associated/transthyretin-like domain-containing protein [Ichthyenterobacterium magnum]|uniref:Carboxypeptidase-like protein n=1 Tax=Ichthyenterobacterium magnum TaxID=1230530 RepID=A0A420DUY6_9FLAO|nr:hypothetical protein [Ichthyenterobacterium magnum]RKE98055.1 hypothetical protein BXY80_0120 [Ichthyenterobacterium magnum]